jgi:hypothetical protein
VKEEGNDVASTCLSCPGINTKVVQIMRAIVPLVPKDTYHYTKMRIENKQKLSFKLNATN